MGNASVLKLVTFLLAHVPWAYSAFCDSPSPGYPIPDLAHRDHAAGLSGVIRRITSTIEGLISDPTYNTTHYSLEITTQTTTLLSTHHTAAERSTIRRGAEVISNSTNYRIASMTKPFTVLALLQQHKAGNLSLDDPVAKYLPDLDTTGHGKGAGGLPWKDITIRALASQLSGIPRDFAQGDLINSPDLAARLGLPPAEGLEMPKLPSCDEMVNYSRACGPSDLLKWVDQATPVYAPNQKSTYSNINYDLLGLVIAKVSGLTYEHYIQTRILDVVGMTGSSFSTPSDDVAAITKGIEYYWPLEIGVQNPTGGLYSNTADLSRWLRYVLSSYNGQDSAVNWFNPASWSGSLTSFYGMPWEIFRAKFKDVVKSPKGSTMPLTFVTKEAGCPGIRAKSSWCRSWGWDFRFWLQEIRLRRRPFRRSRCGRWCRLLSGLQWSSWRSAMRVSMRMKARIPRWNWGYLKSWACSSRSGDQMGRTRRRSLKASLRKLVLR